MSFDVVILGGGESGVGAALLARRRGLRVWLSEKGRLRPEHRETLTTHGIPYEEGRHTEKRLLEGEVVVKSPGIPEEAPPVQLLRRHGREPISEIEFAARFTDALLVGITGSNGKTTTTLLTHHLLKSAGWDAEVCGNVGKSFARCLSEGERRCYVLELSSFQLDGIVAFRPRVGVLLNISPDHLDRYGGSLERYARSKLRLTLNQQPEDLLIYNSRDEWLQRLVPTSGTRARLLGLEPPEEARGLLNAGGRTFEMPEHSLQGVHNRFNAACAVAVALELGVPPDAVQQGLLSFRNPPHRLETVADQGGVRFINDSKATNVEAVRYALLSMDRPVVWIAGGTDKGNDYAPLLPLVREKVRALVCLGLDNRKLRATFEGLVPAIAETRSMDEAVALARSYARPGDVVLLSPACASFDLFRNFEDRGDQFRRAVLHNDA